MARILVVCHSQTGQLRRIVESMLSPLAERDDVTLVWHDPAPERPYPFPWTFMTFLDAFPESVYLDPPPMAQARFDPDADYDLVVLAWQVWFLAPSLPVTGFLRSPEARALRGRRVVTVVGCRNMWTTAHRTMIDELSRLEARLVDNVVLTDSGPFWSTFITTPRWLLTGRREPLLGVLPRAGVSDADIRAAARFGHALVAALPAIREGATGPFLRGLAAVHVNPLTMLSERIGHRSFRIWGRLLRALGGPGSAWRQPVLLVYVAFLVGAIVCLLPVSMFITWILSRTSAGVQAAADAMEGPSGSSGERLAQFDRR